MSSLTTADQHSHAGPNEHSFGLYSSHNGQLRHELGANYDDEDETGLAHRFDTYQYPGNSTPSMNVAYLHDATPRTILPFVQDHQRHDENIERSAAWPSLTNQRPHRIRAPDLTDEDWAPVYARIVELWDEGMTAVQIKYNIEDDVSYNFIASIGQYRHMLRRWGLGRYISKKARHFIVRDMAKREAEGKRPRKYYKNGKEISQNQISRWTTPREADEDEDDATDVSIPPEIEAVSDSESADESVPRTINDRIMTTFESSAITDPNAEPTTMSSRDALVGTDRELSPSASQYLAYTTYGSDHISPGIGNMTAFFGEVASSRSGHLNDRTSTIPADLYGLHLNCVSDDCKCKTSPTWSSVHTMTPGSSASSQETLDNEPENSNINKSCGPDNLLYTGLTCDESCSLFLAFDIVDFDERDWLMENDSTKAGDSQGFEFGTVLSRCLIQSHEHEPWLLRASLGPGCAFTGHQVSLSQCLEWWTKFGENNIGSGNYELAEWALKEVINEYRQLGPDGQLEAMKVQILLGSAYYHWGDYQRAATIHRETVAYWETMPAGDSRELLHSRSGLAMALCHLGSLDEAERTERQILETLMRSLNVDEEDKVTSLRNMITIHSIKGNLEVAQKYAECAQGLCERIFGKDDIRTLKVKSNLANVFTAQEKYSKAQELEEQLRDSYVDLRGPKHRDTLISKHNLAITYVDMGNFAKAIELFEEVICGRKQVLPYLHEDTVTSMNKLVLAWLDQEQDGYLERCAKYCKDLLDECRERYGDDHPETTHCMETYAEVLHKSGCHEEAIHMMSRCVEYGVQKWGSMHPNVRDAQKQLSEWQACAVIDR